METLQDIIKTDFKNSRKNKEIKKSKYLSLIVAEFQRQQTKEINNATVLKILKQLIKGQEELKKTGNEDVEFTKIIKSYLPKQATEDEIRKWIDDNIDFSKFKNKMQSMKFIMQEFADKTNGNIVKNILNNLGEK